MKRSIKRVTSSRLIQLKRIRKRRLELTALPSKLLSGGSRRKYLLQSQQPKNRKLPLQKPNRPRASNACSGLLHLYSAPVPPRKLWPRAQLKPKVAEMVIRDEVALPTVIAVLRKTVTNDEANVVATAEDVAAIATLMLLLIRMRTQMTRLSRNLVMPDAAAMVVDVGEDVEATPLPITKQAKRQILQPAINVAVGEENVQKAKTPKLRLLPIQMPQPSWTRAATTATNKPLR